MGYKRFEREAVKKFKKMLLDADIGYKELSERLEKVGVKESPSAIASKISRGRFKASFLMAVKEACRS